VALEKEGERPEHMHTLPVSFHVMPCVASGLNQQEGHHPFSYKVTQSQAFHYSNKRTKTAAKAIL
jgi:hypothetical protein